MSSLRGACSSLRSAVGTWPGTKKHVYQDGWIYRFFDTLRANADWIKLSTLSEVVDNVAPISCAYEQRDRLLAQNRCAGGAAVPVEPWAGDIFDDLSGSECLKYLACPKEYPVIFCRTAGFDHSRQDQWAIPAFTRFVTELDAAL